MKRHLLLCFGLLGASPLHAQQLRFYARPVEINEGGAVTFNYREDVAGTLPLSNILGWRWDFNGDGIWDEVRNVDETTTVREINTTWYATFDAAVATNGTQAVTPILEVRRAGDPSFETPGASFPRQVGVTENTVGPDDGSIDSQIFVKDRTAGNADVVISTTANPRLAKAGTDTIRLFANLKPQEGKKLTSSSYYWNVVNRTTGGSQQYNTATPQISPVMSFFAEESFDLQLQVSYVVSFKNKLGQEVTSSGTLYEEKKDAFRVVSVPNSLQLGRAYRRGFPDTLNWDDIAASYQAASATGNRYVYFGHLEEAFFHQQSQLVGDALNPNERRQMAEVVNELLQGQLMIANQRLVEALRIKYPRLAASTDETKDRLDPPAGVREETAAIDTALLDYSLPIQYAAQAIQLYGLNILRNKAAEGSEPFPQFPQYLTFLDPTLSQAPVPIKNELWQLSTALGRECLGRVEKAKKLFRLSAQDAAAKAEAKEEAKVAGLHSYLGMALLAASQQPRDFQQNEGNDLLAHQNNARDLFERINAGVNPVGNDGSFIPNESFAAIYQDAQEAVSDARESEITARNEKRNFDRNQADLRNEQQSQRAGYLTPLRNLTNLDPALYNDLKTADDQEDFRSAVESRVKQVRSGYPNTDAHVAGELGSGVIAVLDAEAGVEMAKNDVKNVLDRVDFTRWNNKQVFQEITTTGKALGALDMIAAAAEAMMTLSVGTSSTVSNPAGGVMKGAVDMEKRLLQSASTSRLNDLALQKEVQIIYLELANREIALKRAVNNHRLAQLALDNMLGKMSRMIEDLSHTRETAADLYFQDPSFRVVVSQSMKRAEGELDYAIDRLYRLAKTLQYEWTEPYQNPLIIPVNSQEPASLENPLFDKFTQLDSLFFVRNADEAKDYLDALKAWDSKLRRINVVSVRGPNHSGPISAEPISLRETVLNLRPDASRGYTLEKSIRDFRNVLETKRKAGYYNTMNPSLEIPITTTIESNAYFPATGSRWNMRIASVAVDLYAESGFNTKQVAEIDLIQSGIVSLRRYWANPPLADDISRLTFNVDNINRSAFAVAFPARINGAMGGRPAEEFNNLGLADRPIAATQWILRINTENPTNRDVDFSKLKDIVIRFNYTFGNPAEFPNF